MLFFWACVSLAFGANFRDLMHHDIVEAEDGKYGEKYL